MTTNFFSPLSFVAVFGSGIRDPRSGIRDPRSEIRDPGSGMGKNQDPGSEINIPDPHSATLRNTVKSSVVEPEPRAEEPKFLVSYKTIRSRSRNSDLRLCGAGAERNIFGSTTLMKLKSKSSSVFQDNSLRGETPAVGC
jgi:hypothetical protein